MFAKYIFVRQLVGTLVLIAMLLSFLALISQELRMAVQPFVVNVFALGYAVFGVTAGVLITIDSRYTKMHAIALLCLLLAYVAVAFIYQDATSLRQSFGLGIISSVVVPLVLLMDLVILLKQAWNSHLSIAAS